MYPNRRRYFQVSLRSPLIAMGSHPPVVATSRSPTARSKAPRNTFAAVGSLRHSATVTPRGSYLASSSSAFLRFPLDFNVISNPTGGVFPSIDSNRLRHLSSETQADSASPSDSTAPRQISATW